MTKVALSKQIISQILPITEKGQPKIVIQPNQNTSSATFEL